MSINGRACKGLATSLLANTSEDIEKKRHKRNPFGLQYIKLLSTPLDEVRCRERCQLLGEGIQRSLKQYHANMQDEPAHLQPDDAREALDSAAANINIRIEVGVLSCSAEGMGHVLHVPGRLRCGLYARVSLCVFAASEDNEASASKTDSRRSQAV